MKKVSAYGVLSIISLIIRHFVLPNPFMCFGEQADYFNWIAEPIIHAIAYAIVGLFYIKGSAPEIGCVAYLMVYSLITGALLLCGVFAFAWWWILIVVIAFMAVSAGGIILFFMFSNRQVQD